MTTHLHKVARLFVRVVTDEGTGWTTPPRVFGVAWRKHAALESVFMLIPLNILCAAIRKVWWRLRLGLRPALAERIRNDAHLEGRYRYEKEVRSRQQEFERGWASHAAFVGEVAREGFSVEDDKVQSIARRHFTP